MGGGKGVKGKEVATAQDRFRPQNAWTQKRGAAVIKGEAWDVPPSAPKRVAKAMEVCAQGGLGQTG